MLASREYARLPTGTFVNEPEQLHGAPGTHPEEAHTAVCDTLRSTTIKGNTELLAFVILVDLIGSMPPTMMFTGVTG